MFRTIGFRFSGTAVSPHKNIQRLVFYLALWFDVCLGVIILSTFRKLD